MAISTPQVEPFAPPEPETLEQAGLTGTLLEQLILRILYFRGELYGQDLSNAVGLPFSVIADVVEELKLRHHVQIKRSLGMGTVGALLALTEAGRSRAHDYLDVSQYSGPAPVPLNQYAEVVRRQRLPDGWLTKQSLAKAFRGMVITEGVLKQLGPAISSASSLLLHGKPGDGKTMLIESLVNLDTAPIFLPYSIECQGNIIQVYDPIYHQRIDEEQPSVAAIAMERSWDRRWVRCKRPFIVSGGELSLDMLDLRYNQASKIYEAPFQLKANNGIYLIDDFGRQLTTPAEVLNRWIVPMERRLDYLSFLTGGKMTAPFETFLVFSTNLNPESLGDEAFLRRIQYKLLLRGPAEREFIRIFERFCAARQVPCPRDLVVRLIDRHYRRSSKVFRRCHPRDILTHAFNLIHFEKLPLDLTDEVLDHAFESCFVQEHDGASPGDTAIVRVTTQTCAEYWDERVEQIPTAFGRLAFAASCRDRATGEYEDPVSSLDYDEVETSRALARLHARAFTAWLSLNLEQQSRDLARYLATEQGQAAFLSFEKRELQNLLAPAAAEQMELQLFAHDLGNALQGLRQRVAPETSPATPLPQALVHIEGAA